MSYTSIITFKLGLPAGEIEFRNAWGGCARIWDSLFAKYIKDPNTEYDSWITQKSQSKLWDLAKQKDLPDFERCVHVATFDLAYIKREHFGVFCGHLKMFYESFPVPGRVDHLPAWIEAIENLSPEIEAIGFYGTSVGENLWYRLKSCEHCGNSTDDSEGVPLLEGFEVYEWFSSH